MSTRVASATSHAAAVAAAIEIADTLEAGLDGAALALVHVFASTAQPLGEIAPTLTARFPTATVLGASTAGEFTERGDAKSSVAAFALAGDYKVFAGIGTGLRE